MLATEGNLKCDCDVSSSADVQWTEVSHSFSVGYHEKKIKKNKVAKAKLVRLGTIIYSRVIHWKTVKDFNLYFEGGGQ